MAKRAFDLLAAGLGLVLLAPLMLWIAWSIKRDTPGPVLFRQERVGRHGKPFMIRKFRTMVHAPGTAGAQITVGADPRITRYGAWLRARKLDELPQLIDVLVGTMSLVGPRPEVPRYVARYPAALRDVVLSVRPGITDPASIAFRDEAELLARAADPEREYVELILPQKLEHAARYARCASLATDLGVLLRTLAVLATRS
ncbi:MAG: sugar transferase [Proteobacteria bacterium]|nr:sugar transferase [Pseudomonadota bacterium]